MSFIQDDRGAVTVDWVVLTAALVGLGLATAGVVSVGVQDTSGDVKTALNNQIIYSSFGISGETFINGAGGWTGASASEVTGLGMVLGPIEGGLGLETVSKTFDVPNDSGYAKLTFDLFALDSLDNGTGGPTEGHDTAHLYINGTIVATGTPNADHIAMDWTFHDVPDVDVYATEVRALENFAGSHYNDSEHAITIVVQNPGEQVTLGFGSNANQSASDESYAIDNVVLEASGIDNYPDF